MHNQRTEPVDTTVVIEVLPSDENDLDRNRTVLNRTVKIAPDGTVPLREEPFSYNGEYSVTVRTNVSSTESRIIKNYNSTLDSFIEIRITSDEVRITEVV